MRHRTSESNDRLFIHYPFEYLEGVVSNGFSWVAPNNCFNFIWQRWTPHLGKKAKKIWNMGHHTLIWAVRLGRNLRILRCSRDEYSIWNSFWVFGKLDQSLVLFFYSFFCSILCNLRTTLLSHEIDPWCISLFPLLMNSFLADRERESFEKRKRKWTMWRLLNFKS